MAHFTQACGNSTQTNTTSLNRFVLPNSDCSSVKIAAPSPFMVQKKQYYSQKKNASYNGIVGCPRPARFKPTEASHARMVLKIRKQIDPAFFLPDIANPSPLLSTSTMLHSAVSATADMAKTLFRGLSITLNSVPSNWIGLPTAEAAHANALGEFETVDSFVNTFKKDFMIKVSPSLKGSSLKGATLLIGEIHFQKNLEEGVLRILNHLRPERGDMLLMEGGDDVCPSRVNSYGIPAENCINLEENSAAYLKVQAAFKDMSNQLKLTVQYIVSHLPQKLKEVVLVGNEAYVDFIRTHGKDVPVKFKSELDANLRKCKQLISILNGLLTDTVAPREQDMLAQIKKWKGRNSLNVAILGAQHVVNFATYTKEKIIFIMPRLVLDTNPEMNLPLDKDEL